MTSSHDIKKLVTVNVNSALQDYMLFNEMTATYIQLLLQFKPLTELMPGLYVHVHITHEQNHFSDFLYLCDKIWASNWCLLTHCDIWKLISTSMRVDSMKCRAI